VTSIDIVICATAAGRSLARCVDAVVAQGPQRLWLAPVDLDARERDDALATAHGSATDVRVLHPDGPGLAAVRNAALAASDADVLAFVEADVVVAAGWLAALHGAWDAAHEHVAAIGGPIELDLGEAPPRWLGEALHASFATLDYGGAPLVLDPAQRTLHGGNLSARCAPLRAVGGFLPAYGHHDGRDWLSEEHHAQRELADAGWEVRYEPAVRVSRIPAPAMLRPARILRRRWRYGARMGVVDPPRSAMATVSAAASSAAGAALAAARGNQALAIERAARAAQHGGSLLGRPFAARDFRATGPRPFGSAIEHAPPRRRRRRAVQRGSGAAILLYHRVAEPTNGSDGMCVAPERFADQLERLKAHPVLRLDELAELAHARRVPAGAVAVSFDDGYRDTLVDARPRLSAAGIPATVFVTTGHVATQRPFFWDELERRLVLGGSAPWPPLLTLSFPDGPRAWRTDTPELRDHARSRIHYLIQPASAATIAGVLAELAAWRRVEPARGGPGAMTIDELRALAADPLIAVGAHTRGHTNLGFQDGRRQREEIERSRADLRDWLGEAPAGFSYPFGIPDVDFHATTRRLVADAGFRYAVANQRGTVSARSDPYALPRHVVPNLGGDAFSAWLRAVLRG
jgi:peptidoglycan/xylan/chitin deacetylase (PgdA/CDA1 family)